MIKCIFIINKLFIEQIMIYAIPKGVTNRLLDLGAFRHFSMQLHWQILKYLNNLNSVVTKHI